MAIARRAKKLYRKRVPRQLSVIVIRAKSGALWGRPTTLTMKVAAKLVRAARDGVLLNGCADLAGVTRQSLFGWLKRGEAGAEQIEHGVGAIAKADEIYVKFFNSFTKARGEREREAHQRLRHGTPEWQAHAWWLQHTKPAEYGRRIIQAELTGKDGQPITHADVTAELTDDERLRRFRALVALVPAAERGVKMGFGVPE